MLPDKRAPIGFHAWCRAGCYGSEAVWANERLRGGGGWGEHARRDSRVAGNQPTRAFGEVSPDKTRFHAERAGLVQRVGAIELKQLETDKRIDTVFDALDRGWRIVRRGLVDLNELSLL